MIYTTYPVEDHGGLKLGDREVTPGQVASLPQGYDIHTYGQLGSTN